MSLHEKRCPDCDSSSPLALPSASRRQFLQTAGAVAAVAALPNWAVAKEAAAEKPVPETLVKQLYDSLTEKQRKEVAFDWDFTEEKRGLLRTRVSNNWHITTP